MSGEGAGVALVLLARNPTAARTGRIAVLESAVKGLQRSGVTVHVLAVTSAEGANEWLGCPVTRLRPLSLPALAVSALKAVVTGRTLNSAIFDSRRLRRVTRDYVRHHGIQVVVADGLRTFNLASSCEIPVITHLDDLLSSRYGAKEFVEGNPSILGYYGNEIPGLLRPLVERVLAAMLRVESRRAAREEVHIARRSAVAAMTSHEEARELSEDAGVTVAFLPMGVEVARSARPHEAPAASAVFVGALHYGPNITALRFIQDEVLPVLRAKGYDLELDVVGLIGDNSLGAFHDRALRFTDYAPDLVEALAGHRMLLSPITAGTGVKTKALDGMSVALPVVATTLGVAGVPVTPGKNVLVGDTPEDYADAMIRLMEDPELARTIGEAGCDILRGSMTSDAVHQSWAEAYRRALSLGRSRG